MTIEPRFLAELRSRLALSDIVGRKVQFDRRKSNPRKRDFWGCCPFHHEKTPSFHVEDDKGRYYCFGCHAKGDVVTFVMETESLSFREAVEMLAREAGLQVPAQTPQARAAERVRATLSDAVEQAQQFFRQSLMAPGAEQARAYLDGRKLDRSVIERFGLGFAPPSSRALLEHLKNHGVDEGLAVKAGLAGQKEGRAPYDYFRNRIMFPIRDRQGRVIGFGGRVLDTSEPKYLNSPETELFKKGQVLYNLDRARSAVRETGVLILAEGYMDVIAFDRAGLGSAVAPLGTALTEDQLREAWRLSPEPVLCFDGDDAGLRAAYRALDLALPHVTPSRTLRFALLPKGLDPDDLLREGGAEAVRRAVEGAHGLADLLWRREQEVGPLDTPERRAGLEARLEEAVGRISEQGLRYHFLQDMRARSRAFFRAQGGQRAASRPGPRSSRPFFAPDPVATPELRASLLARSAAAHRPSGTLLARTQAWLDRAAARAHISEERILALALRYPYLVERDAETLADLDFTDDRLDRLRRALLALMEEETGLDSQGVKVHLSNGGIGSIVEQVQSCEFMRSDPAFGPDTPTPAIETGWQDAISRYRMVSTHRTELRKALDAFLLDNSPDNEARLMDVCRQVEAATGRPEPDRAVT